ncbi:hypothetical protein Tco_0255209 [Tanacetum coccineum]
MKTLGTIARKDIDIKEGLKVKAYEISVVKKKHDEFVKHSLLTKSHYEGLVKEKTKVITDLKLKEEKDIDTNISHWKKPIKFLNETGLQNGVNQSKHSYVSTKFPTFNGRLICLSNVPQKRSTMRKHVCMRSHMDQSDPVNRLVLDREESTLTLEKRELVDQAWEKHSHDHFRAPTAHDMEILIKTCLMPLALKTQNDSFTFVHELKQEMHADLKYCLYLHKVKECECLAQKLSKQTETIKQMKNDTVCKEKTSNVFLKEREQYFKIQDLKAQLQDKNFAISELKKLTEKCKVKSMETKFDKPSVVRQPNAQRIPKPSVLGKPTLFSDSLERKSFSKTKSAPKTNMSEGLSKPLTTHILPQTARQATSRNTNPCVSTSTRVIYRNNVSRPQLRSTQIKDKVMPNNSQVKFKKTEVEDHHMISSISNTTKSVTACNDSLKSKTSNVNTVCATCRKYVFNSNHDACVSKFLNDMSARTKKPKVVPISTRQPKSQANKSVATPPKKTVASESTI